MAREYKAYGEGEETHVSILSLKERQAININTQKYKMYNMQARLRKRTNERERVKGRTNSNAQTGRIT